MFIRSLLNCTEIVAGDGTRLRELLHPERDLQFSGRYSLAHATLPAGENSQRHRLKAGEVYYILSGRGLMHIGDSCGEVKSGDAVHIPPGAVQWLENAGNSDLCFLCVVDPAWCSKDEEVL